MDIHMPILDGIETSRSIRTSFAKPKSDIPIVAFTANALKGDKDKYLEAGMNAYISKPFMPEELFKILTKYYRPKESGTELQKDKSLTNLSYLRKMSNNDESFVQDMIASFCENTPGILESMKEALNTENWQEVGAMAHKLKPNLAFMGIDSLKDLIIAIEVSGKNNENTTELPEKVNTLIASLDIAIEELKI